MNSGLNLPSARRALVVVLGLALLHMVLVFGYAGPPWGEHGATLDALARYAAGQVPYRDFTWPHLPLSLWLFGGFTRVAGAGMTAVNIATALLFLALVAAYVGYVRMLKPEVLLAAVLSGLVLALAYASGDGVPLPFGTADPAKVVGTLALLGAAATTIALMDHATAARAVAAPVLAGLCALAAPAFWTYSLYLMAACALTLHRSALPDKTRRIAIAAGAFGGTLALGAALVLAQSGWHGLGAAITQSGRLGIELTQRLPSWERLVVEIFVSAAAMLMGVASLWLCLAIREGRAARWGGALLLVVLTTAAIHLGMSINIGQELQTFRPPDLPTPIQQELALDLSSGASLAGSALSVLNHRAERHIVPALLPALMFLLVLTRGRRWGEPSLRRRVLMLLGLCIAGRLWTGWAGTEWYEILLEMPVYALCVQFGAGAWGPRAGRAVLTALSLALIVGAFEYYNQGRGLLTQRGREPTAVTAHGTVHWPGFTVRQFQAARAGMDGRDPMRRRAVLPFGGAGGWNYFLGRTVAGHVEALAAPAPGAEGRRAAAFLLDFPSAPLVTMRPGLWLFRWENAMQLAREQRVDRPRFNRLAAACDRVALPDTSGVAVRIYDCASSAGAPQATR